MEQDKIIEHIENRTINSEDISFNTIKSFATNPTPPDVHKELDRGHAILDTQDQLNKYLYSYSSMIEHQWVPMFSSFKLTSNNIEIIDYACGQGLASMLFLDRHKKIKNTILNITLIEPSKIALRRAGGILQCYLPKAKITSINKKLDDVTKEEIQLNSDTTKIHLFSNIVDIDVFDINLLLNKITTHKGKNYFMVMSSDRLNFGGTRRLDDFYGYFNKNNNLFTIVKKAKDSFTQINPSNHPGKKDFKIQFVYIETEV